MIGCKVSYHCSYTAMLEPPHIGLFGIFMSTVPHRELDVPAVRTRGLFFLETRISQEMDKTACTHQVSIGTLWWEKNSCGSQTKCTGKVKIKYYCGCGVGLPQVGKEKTYKIEIGYFLLSNF